MQHFIAEFQNAFSPEFCNHLIEKFDNDQRKEPGRTGNGVDKTKKNSSDLYISQHEDWQDTCSKINDIIMQGLVQYTKHFPFLLTGAISPSIRDSRTNELRTITHQDIQSMSDQSRSQMISSMYDIDSINMQKYEKTVGGYHHWHSEHYPHPTDSQQKSLHRVLLWLVYLNDVEVGGETEFYFQQLKVKARRGSMVIAPCYFTHTHRGCIPESSEKYVLASWVMYKDASRLYPSVS